jgi:hypothetical protein
MVHGDRAPVNNSWRARGCVCFVFLDEENSFEVAFTVLIQKFHKTFGGHFR